jgi:CRP-like cAMP-binding protein
MPAVDPHRQPASVPGSLALLEADPDLGAGLNPADTAAARRHLRAAAISVPRGTWEAEGVEPRPGLGLLVLRGLLVREVSVGDRVRAELIGPGDLLRPWDVEPFDTLALPYSCRWCAIEPAELAVLDGQLLPALARWPTVLDELMRRTVRRSNRLALQLAIGELQGVDVRLNNMLWHLAERWGRVTLAGVVVPFALTHEILGRLVGAQRPTVTSALSELAERGVVRRLPDGRGWLLAHEGRHAGGR